jgi:alanine dehydrogenase
MILSCRDVVDLIDMEGVINVVEKAFKDLASKKANMPPKSYLLVDDGDFRAMPGVLPEGCGVKWISVFPKNRDKGLPTIIGFIIYNDPVTSYPLAIMDATELTAFRTGAAAAIASKYLARSDSRTLGIIGAGRQAISQIEAHARLFDFKEIKVFDLFDTAVEKLKQSLPRLPIESTTIEEAVKADIVSTVTPSRTPIVMREWIMPGTHINAVGADAKGKQELDPKILSEAILIVDDVEQASSGGEINVPISQGLFDVANIQATLGEVASGFKPGRTRSGDITIFDSTGIAVQDIAVAKLVYDRARQNQGYLEFDFLNIC